MCIRDRDKIVIGCDQYEEGFLWDGLTLKTSYYDYNGSVLNYNSGTNVMGSIIESDYMKQQFGMIGLNENQIAQIEMCIRDRRSILLS